MLVRATDKYEKLKLKDNELGRIPKKGEEFEVSKERFEVLTKTNEYKAIFVEKVEMVETAIKEVETETAVKKTRKKTK
jgi:hypothetical protein